MFAARRNDKVAGRTKILDVSIRTRNGLSQSGAPSGRKCAIDALGALENVDRIILNHKGNPNVSVKIRCLEVLNIYGIRPIRLIIMISVNRVDTINLIPLRLNMYVRLSCDIMTDLIAYRVIISRDGFIQKYEFIDIIIKIFIKIKMFVDGRYVLKT